MAFFRRSKSPFAHEIDRFHVAQPAAKAAKLVPGTKFISSSPAAQEGRRTSDLTIVALGLTLALICALFPWYIFFNQDQFGVRAMRFQGQGDTASDQLVSGPVKQRVGAPMTLEKPPIELDFLATGTLPNKKDDPLGIAPVPDIEDQPYPGDEAPAPQFRLIHVANGRAMIQDDAGLWVVQPGSVLPDSSRVVSIEKRSGGWVMVTSSNGVFELTP